MAILGLAGFLAAVTQLSISGWFTVPVSNSYRVKDFVVHEDTLHFLVVSANGAEVISTNHTGSLIGSIVLPGPDATRASALRADSSGNLAVLLRNRLVFVNTAGQIANQVTLKHSLSDIAFLGNQLVGFNEGSSAILRQPDETPMFTIDPPVTTPALLLALAGKRLAILEAGIPRLRIMTSPALPPVRLFVPELRGEEPGRSADGAVEEVIYSAVSDGSGGVLCGIGRYAPKMGATVLQFDEKGVLKNEFRCMLPVFQSARSRANPGGYMLTSVLGVSKGSLFMVSKRDNACAYYNWPPGAPTPGGRSGYR
jgi:hypothetical protein